MANFDPSQPRDSDGTWGDGGGSAEANTISDNEKQALKVYTHAGSYPVNDYLRNGTLPQDSKYANATPVRDEEDLHGAIKGMDSAFDKASLDKDTTVFRGVDRNAWAKISQANVGDIIEDKGFASTSLAKVTSSSLSNYMKIKVPQGAKAIPLDGVVANRTKGEILLARGTQFRVVSKTKNGMELEVLK